VRAFLVVAAFALATVLALGIQTALVARAGFLMGDFHAFYCAARVASQGADPYRTEPLRACEKAIGPRAFFAKNPGVTIPAPLPGYTIGALVPLGLLPPVVASAIWLALLLLACAIAVLTVTRFAAVPWPVPIGAFVLSLGGASIPFGEIVPMAIAAICLAAYFAWRGQWIAAAIAAAAAMLEPHLGLPACLGLAIWAPRTRLPLGIAAVVLACLSFGILGGPTNLEYFITVLPAHALSEAARDTQFSLTSVLASLGTADTFAVRAGSLWYVAMLAAGTVVAGWLAKRTQNFAFLVCVPPAFAVFGGTFVHVTQIAVALPAALLLLSYANAQRRALAVVAVMLLAVPWIMAWSPVLGLAPAFPIGYLAWRYWNGNLRAVVIAIIVTLIVVVGLNESLALAATHSQHLYVGSPIDPDLAEASWGAFTSKSSTGALGAWLVRIPTWIGLMLLLGLTTSEAGLPRLRMLQRRLVA
jgi:hypothetical protein